ncbi:hypothetical protein BS47DRAFT_1369643 [Hydnum rufescens UP504]|uniref:Uncharacterized protein n=1 Tax=Hydnum rufescens UP504 TaxID=1448309 RepID=A0A9P6ACP9_9AGAM|nr:hypothetical protein BS47DRAFT_1369643 [Hydnum rufescens UP504]
MAWSQDASDGDRPIERLNDTTPNDTADITPHRTTPASAGVVLHKVICLKYIQQDEDPPNEPPPANDNAPETKATNAPRQKNERQTKPRNEDTLTQDDGTPQTNHTPASSGLIESAPDNLQTHLSPVRKFDRGRHTTAVWYYKAPGAQTNHTPALAGVVVQVYNVTMGTHQTNHPPNDKQPHTQNRTRDRGSNEYYTPTSGSKLRLPNDDPPQQTPGTSPNDQPNVTSLPSPNEEAEGTTHPLGRCHTPLSSVLLSFFLSFYGWYHTPAQAGWYHTPAHAVLIGRVLNMQMGNRKARLGRPQIYV